MAPSAYDVLACLDSSEPGSFEDFCSEFGYDEDSHRAYRVYEAVSEQASELQELYNTEELEQLAEIA